MTYKSEYDIILLPSFNKELDNIYNYIYMKLNSPNVAKKLYKLIKSEISKLNLFPERYSKIFISNKKYQNQNLRKIIIKNYVIIYQVDNDTRKSLYFTYISWKTKLFKSNLILNFFIFILNIIKKYL